MTREKYESLPLSMLKALAKSRNMKGISTLRKEALIERMLEEDQKENQKNMEEPAVLKEEKRRKLYRIRIRNRRKSGRTVWSARIGKPRKTAPRARTRDRGMSAGKSAVKTESDRSTVQERRVSMSVDLEPRNYNQNNREEEQRQEPRQEAGQEMRQEPLRQEARPETRQEPRQETSTLDSGRRRPAASSRSCRTDMIYPPDNYMPGDSDVYVSPSQIRRFGLKTEISSAETRE